MPFNSVFGWIIKKRVHQIELFKKYPNDVQTELFHSLIDQAAMTRFGIEHGFPNIRSVADFRKAVPVRNYEAFVPYIDALREGQQNILWPSKVKWFAKSSGTTDARSKFIPVSKEALEECHYKGGKDLLALYMDQRPNAKLYNGKTLVVGGSSRSDIFNEEGYTGDLSAIIIRNLPIWVELRRTPSREIALLENWEEKIERMAATTSLEDVSILVGVPSWTMLLIKRIMQMKGVDSIFDVWPNLELYMHGGVSFKPYRAEFAKLAPGNQLNYLETYNASEGFFAIQDRIDSDDLLLMLDYGIYYEFMPMSEYGKSNPETVSLREVEIGENYAVVISTNAGLWRYLVGDTVRFTSVLPYRIQITGRTRHYINVFGEEVMVENADTAIEAACRLTGATIADYTVAPQYMQGGTSGSHQWLIEFIQPPNEHTVFAEELDRVLRQINSDYDAKRTNNYILSPAEMVEAPSGLFYQWLKKENKLGGQNKVPRLCNDRRYMDDMLELASKICRDEDFVPVAK
jgi:GH3 auxin-responsive promoter